MTSKERVFKAINFEESDRCPYDIRLDYRLADKLKSKYGEKFDSLSPFGSDLHVQFFFGTWLTKSKTIKKNGENWQVPGLTSLDELVNFQWPAPLDDSIYANLSEEIEKAVKTIFVGIPGIMSVADILRGYEGIFMDIYDNPVKLEEMMRCIFNVQKKVVERVCEMGIDVLYLLDDIAGNKGLLMSQEHLEKYVLKYDEELIRIAKDKGIKVAFHSDGNIIPILNRLIEMGADIVNPLRPVECDLVKFRQQYKGKLVVYGGLDNAGIIRRGTPKEIENHIVETFHLLGDGGGLILSCHEIPDGTPVENIEMMVHTLQTKCLY